MSKRFSIIALLATCFALTGCAVKQGNQEEAKQEERIAVTSVAVLQILDALEVDNVVGVPKTESEIPDRYKEVEQIGAPMSPDLEVLATVSPTIVLSPISLEGDLKQKYEGAGLDSYFVNLDSVEGMYSSIAELGKRFGKEEKAEELVKQYESWAEEQKKKQESREEKSVLILMGLPGSYVVATEHSYIGNLVALAGGKNCYEGQSEEDFINVNTEDMLKKNPDVIIRTSHAMPEQVMEMFKKEFSENDIWKHFEAVKNKQVFDLTSTDFGMSSNLNYAKAVEEVEGYLYP